MRTLPSELSSNANGSESGHSRREWPKWFGPVVALFSLLLAFALLEFGLRLLLSPDEQKTLPYFALSESLQARLAWVERQQERPTGTTSYPNVLDSHHPVRGWMVNPNVSVMHVKPDVYEVSISTNELGLRGTNSTDSEKSPGVPRVGVFGCSQTFGETVDDDDTYVERLNREQLGADFLNFGVRGYGNDQMLLYYDQEADAYDLDIVILAFAFYHMERNARSFLYFEKPYFTLSTNGDLKLAGTPVRTPEELMREDFAPHTWHLADKSVLLRWVWQRYRNLKARFFYAETGDNWHLTKALLTHFVESARSDGKKIVLMNIDESHPELEDDLVELVDTLRIDLVNLGPALRTAGASGIEYAFPNDYHWNAQGHTIVARELRDYLCKHRVLPQCESQVAARR